MSDCVDSNFSWKVWQLQWCIPLYFLPKAVKVFWKYLWKIYSFFMKESPSCVLVVFIPFINEMFCFFSAVSKKNKDGQTREQDYSSESHYRIVSPTFQYKMSHQRVGKCIIINNKNFDEKTGTANGLTPVVLIFVTWKACILSKVSRQGWMYVTARTETLVSCSNVSRALASTSTSITIRRVRRWSVFSERVSIKVIPGPFWSSRHCALF